VGIAVYGRRVAETATEVRYEVLDDPDGVVDGVLVIDERRPTERWWVEGENASTGLAARIAVRAYRRFQDTGEWPQRAAHQA
jgi:hypothetical protein